MLLRYIWKQTQHDADLIFAFLSYLDIRLDEAAASYRRHSSFATTVKEAVADIDELRTAELSLLRDLIHLVVSSSDLALYPVSAVRAMLSTKENGRVLGAITAAMERPDD